jgi:hypothetical protein
MLFSSGILLAGGATLFVAWIDKVAEGYGIEWLGTTLKLLLPIIGFSAGIYFLENNPLLRWL